MRRPANCSPRSPPCGGARRVGADPGPCGPLPALSSRSRCAPRGGLRARQFGPAASGRVVGGHLASPHRIGRGSRADRPGAVTPCTRRPGGASLVTRVLHSSRVRVATAASVAVGAAAVATVLGISLANANNQLAHLQGAIGEATIVAAVETPGHTFITLTTARHRDVAQFVVLPSGRGYLVTSSLPRLPSTETYQLWGLIDHRTISLGLLGRAPHLATFTSAGSSRPNRLGVTVEAAGGARQPRGPMLASGPA